MAHLNYHHLRYFWMVAREGTIARACAQLHLTEPTVSGQLHVLEKAVRAKLFNRAGRNLVLTDTGRVVYRFADEIFTLGGELLDTLNGALLGRPLRLVAGVVETLPKQIAYRLLEPCLRLPEAVQITCNHGSFDYLLTRLAVNALDVVLSDCPVSPAANIRAFNHLLGECGVSFWGTDKMAAAYRRGFPRSLNGAPLLLPTENTVLRRSLEQWFDAEGIRPLVRAEFADPALLKEFGGQGTGIFVMHTLVEKETRRRSNVCLIGRVESIREHFYVISVEKRLKHPAVVAITAAARENLFA